MTVPVSCIVEPLNNGQVGKDHFVHYREVILFRRQKSNVTLYMYIGWCIGKCSLYRGDPSIINSEPPLYMYITLLYGAHVWRLCSIYHCLACCDARYPRIYRA